MAYDRGNDRGNADRRYLRGVQNEAAGRGALRNVDHIEKLRVLFQFRFIFLRTLQLSFPNLSIQQLESQTYSHSCIGFSKVYRLSRCLL